MNPSRLPLSVVTIALNEEVDLPVFLDLYSKFASEIVIFDDGSTDRTRQIVESFCITSSIPVILATRESAAHALAIKGGGPDLRGFADKRNYAGGLGTAPWQLHVDVDMLPTPDFIGELRDLILSTSQGYAYVRRKDLFLGVPLTDSPRRLWNKAWLFTRGAGGFAGIVHEDFVPRGTACVGAILAPMVHLGDATFMERLYKNVRYTELERRRSTSMVESRVPLFARSTYRALRAGVAALARSDGLDWRRRALWTLYVTGGTLLRELAIEARHLEPSRQEVLASIVAKFGPQTEINGPTGAENLGGS